MYDTRELRLEKNKQNELTIIERSALPTTTCVALELEIYMVRARGLELANRHDAALAELHQAGAM